MAQFVRVPPEQLSPEALDGLLEEFASRDGTDYGEREISLEDKCLTLHRKLVGGEIVLLYDLDSQQWDLIDGPAAAELPDNEL